MTEEDESSDKEMNLLMKWSNGISFVAGSPGVELMKRCSEMLLTASKSVLGSSTIDIGNLFRYGAEQGDADFREQLSCFLSHEYRDKVKSANLMVTAGATQGLHAILSLLCDKASPIFVEDPSYFFAVRMIRDDLQMNLVPVPCDECGINPELLDQFLIAHKREFYKGNNSNINKRYTRFWAAAYLIPVFNNPTGQTYSETRCKELIQLARKHNILLIAEDIYNLIHFDESGLAPQRLLHYDNTSDPDYGGGHVLSNGTFSKIFAPSIRLGWIEGPEQLLFKMYNSNLTWSGGSFNHYMAKLMANILASGILYDHLKFTRSAYQERMFALCAALDELCPDGWSYPRPQGGYFLWITFPQNIDARKFELFARDNYGVGFLPGVYCSPTNSFINCARLSISSLQVDTIIEGAKKLFSAYQGYVIHIKPITD
ncbi:unnamed protein product [Lymnaea stagnalis]|uniref:Aminotransferase class I/classII large domain-containing protein n=1 Tax=Lymnaea stagnalis TaxID=6523 RepID=A0AAV2HJF8_LYMST